MIEGDKVGDNSRKFTAFRWGSCDLRREVDALITRDCGRYTTWETHFLAVSLPLWGHPPCSRKRLPPIWKTHNNRAYGSSETKWQLSDVQLKYAVVMKGHKNQTWGLLGSGRNQGPVLGFHNPNWSFDLQPLFTHLNFSDSWANCCPVPRVSRWQNSGSEGSLLREQVTSSTRAQARDLPQPLRGSSWGFSNTEGSSYCWGDSIFLRWKS